jgi:hypothetical protein
MKKSEKQISKYFLGINKRERELAAHHYLLLFNHPIG